MQKLTDDYYVLETVGRSALLSGDRLLLIDTGVEPGAETLYKELDLAGYKPEDIETIILTHVHFDHVAGLADLMKKCDATTAAHEIEAKYIQKDEIYEGPPGRADNHPGTVINDKLKDNQLYHGLRVIHTPGHTEGHISLLDEEQGILFAGDAFRKDEHQHLAPMPDKFTLDHDQHRESIKKLLGYKFDKIHMAHGSPVMEKGLQQLQKILNHHEF